MTVTSTIALAALTWALDAVYDEAHASVRKLIKNRAAKAELGEITTEAIEAAVAAVPSLAEDIRSPTFVQGVLGPSVAAQIADPTFTTSPQELANRYVEKFVSRWVNDGNEDTALARIFQTDRAQIEGAFAALMEALRRSLFASEHWCDIGRDRTAEATYQATVRLEAKLDALAGSTGLTETSSDDDTVASARRDARRASTDLLNWPRSIKGLFLDRPELHELESRVLSEPRGRTLLTGEAGIGKSALLATLADQLAERGMTVFAIKADLLPASVESIADISRALGLEGDILQELEALAGRGPVVVIIDQLDSVSSLLDQSSMRMTLLLRIARHFERRDREDAPPPVHVVVSSRPFEAAHDARFKSLNATEIKLEPPTFEAVEALLTDLGIDVGLVPEAMRETVRRPFALRLFVELVKRGETVEAISPGSLLDDWLRTANLGDAQERARVLALLNALARSMIETETLWRPADEFDVAHGDAVAIAEAAGLIDRKDGKLGFVHQFWFDDFQAKSLTSGETVAQFAWDRQDGLFSRATVLRALERLRQGDPSQYQIAVDRLLGEVRTRRHLRHLVVDLIATQAYPSDREQGWIVELLQTDYLLASRALNGIVKNWSTWREAIWPLIQELMNSPDTEWFAIQIIGAEAKLDETGAAKALLSSWSGTAHDLTLFRAVQINGLWGAEIAARVRTILERRSIAGWAVGSLISDLAKQGRTEDAADALAAFLEHGDLKADRYHLHGVSELVESDPAAAVGALLPWFIKLASQSEPRIPRRFEFPTGSELPYYWNDDTDEDSLFTDLRAAIRACASAEPTAALPHIQRLASVEVEQCQALAAEALAENIAAFYEEAVAFLLDDARRFTLGETHMDDEFNVGRTVNDYATQRLLLALREDLRGDDVVLLRDAIERWDRYVFDWQTAPEAADRRMFRGWNLEARLGLYACIPEGVFDARTLRQIAEWRSGQPVLRKTGGRMASFIGSPMSAAQMQRATDDALIGVFDEYPDGSGWGDHHRHRPADRSGGAIQLSREFAALAKSDPERVIRLLKERLSPERHQKACGAALEELVSSSELETDQLVTLIHDLAGKEYNSEDWRHNAARALGALSRRVEGLTDQDIDLLRSWIVDDREGVEDRLAQHKHDSTVDRALSTGKQEQKPPHPMIFGRGTAHLGSRTVPAGNLTILEAIASGLLERCPPQLDRWLGELAEHIDRAEDPQVWRLLLWSDFNALYHADREAVYVFFRRLWDAHGEAFTPDIAGALWNYRAMIPPDVLENVLAAWLASDDGLARQTAGEFIAAAVLVEPEHALSTLFISIIEGPENNARLGALFGAAAGWRAGDASIRARSHEILRRFTDRPAPDEAEAIASAVSDEDSLRPVAETKEMLTLIAGNDALLGAAVSTRFVSALQGLLVYPSFQETVLRICERAAENAADHQRQGGSLIDSDLVEIAVALQRGDGEIRMRAMDVYETLLDAHVHDAEQAAIAALRS
mgnify:FL=1